LTLGLFIAALAAALVRYADVTAGPAIAHAFGLPIAAFGMIFGAAPQVFGAVIGLAIAFFADLARALRGWMIVAALAIASLAMLAEAASPSVLLFGAAHFLSSAALGAVLPLTLSLLFDAARRWLATLAAIVAFGAGIAILISTIVGGFLASAENWRTAVMAIAGIGLFLTLLAAILLAGVAGDVRFNAPAPAAAENNNSDAGRLVLVGYAAASIARGGQGAFSAFLLAHDFGFGAVQIGVRLAGASAASVVIAIVVALIADGISRAAPAGYARATSIIGFAAAAALALIALAPSASLAATGITLATVAASSMAPPAYAALRLTISPRRHATAPALLLLGAALGETLGPAVTGMLVTIGGRVLAFGVLAAIMAVAAVLFLPVAALIQSRSTGGETP
jgi:DHA1 family bicyclomycin/chloramphenicol resistance-like MFS transporter